MTSVTTTPTPLSLKHQVLLGKEATPRQQDFYAKFPDFRGMSSNVLDPEIVEAVIVAAMLFGTVRDRVYIYTAAMNESWLLEQYNEIANKVFVLARKEPDPVRAAKGFGQLFQKVAIMTHVLQVPEEPGFWVSFGYRREDPLPHWVQARLLD